MNRYKILPTFLLIFSFTFLLSTPIILADPTIQAITNPSPPPPPTPSPSPSPDPCQTGNGEIQFTSPEVTVNENGISASVTISLQNACLGESVLINWETADGTAIQGEDYTQNQGNLTLTGPASSKMIFFVIIDDNNSEPQEFFTVLLKNKGGTVLDSVTVNILDDDVVPPPPPPPPPTQNGSFKLNLDKTEVSEDGGKISINVIRQNGWDGNVSVTLATSDQSAQNGSDYKSVIKTLIFPDAPGNTVDQIQTVEIEITDDEIPEGSEVFLVQLINPMGGATLSFPQTAVVEIIDNDIVAVPEKDFEIVPTKNIFRTSKDKTIDIKFTLGGLGSTGGLAINPGTAGGFGRHVKIDVYNSVGRLISTILDANLNPGPHTATWNGKNNSGGRVASDIYLLMIYVDGSLKEKLKVAVIN